MTGQPDTVPQRRNREIEMLRFLAAVAIACYHTGAGLCGGAYWGVQFFFMLAGFLLARSIEKSPGRREWGNVMKDCGLYVLKRVRSFWPELFVGSIICVGVFFAGVALRGGDFDSPLRYGAGTFFAHCCLLQMTGACDVAAKYCLNGPTWFLSSMMMCMPLLYIALRRWGVSLLWLLPALVIYVALSFLGDGKIVRDPFSVIGCFYFGNVSAAAALMLGAGLYPLSVALSRLTPSLEVVIPFTCLKWLCYALLGYVYVFSCPPWLNTGWVMSATACVIPLAFSGLCADSFLWNRPICEYAGKLALPIYVSHVQLWQCVNPLAGGTMLALQLTPFMWLQLSVYLVIVIIVGWSVGVFAHRLRMHTMLLSRRD